MIEFLVQGFINSRVCNASAKIGGFSAMLGRQASKNMSNFFFKSSFCQNNRKALVEEGFNPTHFPTLSKALSAKHRFFLFCRAFHTLTL
jgi:hypothetical protein